MQRLTGIRHAECAWATVWQVKVLRAANISHNMAGAQSDNM
jgi:hypothetical protein